MLTDLVLAVSQTNVTKPDLVTTLIGAGPFGVLAALFIWGFIIPKKPYDDIAADRDYWREAFREETKNHQKTREAMSKLEQRGDAAVEAANMTAKLLGSLQHVANKSERS